MCLPVGIGLPTGWVMPMLVGADVSALTTASACFRPGELTLAWLFAVVELVLELPELLQAARPTARATGTPAISMRCHGRRNRWLFLITLTSLTCIDDGAVKSAAAAMASLWSAAGRDDLLVAAERKTF